MCRIGERFSNLTGNNAVLLLANPAFIRILVLPYGISSMTPTQLAQQQQFVTRIATGATIATTIASIMFWGFYPNENYYLVNLIFVLGNLLTFVWLRKGWVLMADLQVMLVPCFGIMWGESVLGIEADFHYIYIPLICVTVLQFVNYKLRIMIFALSLCLFIAVFSYFYPVYEILGLHPSPSVSAIRKANGFSWTFVVVMTFFFSLAFYQEMQKRVNLLLESQAATLREKEKLASSNSLIEMLLHAVSHDLTEPVSLLNTYAELIKRTNNLAQIHEYAAVQQETSIRLKNLIAALIESPRRASHRIEVAPVDWATLLDAQKSQLPYNLVPISVTVSVTGNSPFRSDAYYLNIILRNLLSNAIRYRDPAKPVCEIAISIEIHPDAATILVSDNGIGIAAEALPHIFQMHYQAHALGLGTGMGLYLVHECVKMMQGTIDATAVPGQGTTFRLWLPNDPIEHNLYA